MKKAPLYTEIAEAPSGGLAYWIKADDGVRLRIGLWQKTGMCKGTILFFCGRTGYIEKYGRTVKDFHTYGYSCLVVDWRGQGLSDRLTEDPRTGHVNLFSDYQKDVAAMVKAATNLNLPKPWYLFGNSMGCCIGFRSLSEGLPVAASVFTATMWDISLTPLESLFARPISWFAQAIGKGYIYTPGRKGQIYVLTTSFEENSLTNDPDMYQYYIKQAQTLVKAQIGAPSMGWLYQALKELDSLTRLASPSVPCIAFLGDADSVVGREAIEHRMACWTGGRLELVKNGKHNLLCEVPEIRNPITKQICQFFSVK